jgi:hypothetical protein
MMRKARATSVVMLLLGSTAAHAVSITNRDEREHKVTVIEGEAAAEHVLSPSQTLTGLCLKGCTIRMDNSEDDEYRLTADDVVSIEDGTVYYDGPDSSVGSPTPPAPGKVRGTRG